jgi:hypothetical protein
MENRRESRMTTNACVCKSIHLHHKAEHADVEIEVLMRDANLKTGMTLRAKRFRGRVGFGDWLIQLGSATDTGFVASPQRREMFIV